MSSARQKAERCFALARSTTFPAERKTAVERGERIALAAGLSLDEFDIPGRASRPRFQRFGGYTFSELSEIAAMERMVAAVARAEAEQERRRRQGESQAARAASFLRGRGYAVKRENQNIYHVEGRSVRRPTMVKFAQALGWAE